MSKCKYIDSLFERGLCKSEVLEIIDKDYPTANNSGTVAARYSFFNKENPDHLIKLTFEQKIKERIKKAKKDSSIDTDYVMFTSEEVHELGGFPNRPAYVACPDNGYGEEGVVIEMYYFVGDKIPKTKTAKKKSAKKRAAKKTAKKTAPKKKATKKRAAKKKTKKSSSAANKFFG